MKTCLRYSFFLVPALCIAQPEITHLNTLPFSQVLYSLAAAVEQQENDELLSSHLQTVLQTVFTIIEQSNQKADTHYVDELKNHCLETIRTTLNNSSLDRNKRPSTPEEKEAKTQAAISNVATIVNGVANIVQNPHDKVNVGQSVGSILAGIINIALIASHKPRQPLTNLIEQCSIERFP